MARFIIMFIAFGMIFVSLAAYQPNWVWMQRTTGSGNCRFYNTTTDSQGRTVAVGYIEGEVTIGLQALTSTGPRDGVVAMLDASGEWLWAIAIGGEGSDYIHKLTTDNQDNIYIAGAFSQSFSIAELELISNGGNDILFAKLDSDGNVLNASSVGSVYNDLPGGIAVTPTGEIYLAGQYRNSITIGNTTLTSSSYALFYSKWDASLNPLWAQQGFSILPTLECVSLGSDTAGNLYIVGNFQQQCSFGSPNQIVLASNNISGFIFKLSPEGNGIWGERVSSGNFSILDAFVDPSGNTYVSGDYTFIIESPGEGDKRLDTMPRCGKLGSNGYWQWYEPFADMDGCVFVRIRGDAAGNTYLTGFLWDSFDFGGFLLSGSFDTENVFVAKGNPAGQWQWGIQTQDAGSIFYLGISDISPLPSGDCIITGWNRGESLHFGDFHVSPSTSVYSFLVRVNADLTSNQDALEMPSHPRIQVWPNPSGDQTEFLLLGSKATISEASVYNLKGQLVRQIPRHGHSGSLIWDGYDDDGRKSPRGVYIMHLESGGKNYSKVFSRL